MKIYRKILSLKGLLALFLGFFVQNFNLNADTSSDLRKAWSFYDQFMRQNETSSDESTPSRQEQDLDMNEDGTSLLYEADEANIGQEVSPTNNQRRVGKKRRKRKKNRRLSNTSNTNTAPRLQRNIGRVMQNIDRRAPSVNSQLNSQKARQLTSFQSLPIREKNKWVVDNGGPFSAPLKDYFFTPKSLKEYNSVNKWRPQIADSIRQSVRLMCQAKFIDIKKGPQVQVNQRLKKLGILQLKIWECLWELTSEIYGTDFVVKGLK